MGVASWIRRETFWLCDRLFVHGEYKKFYQETADVYRGGGGGG